MSQGSYAPGMQGQATYVYSGTSLNILSIKRTTSVKINEQTDQHRMLPTGFLTSFL